MANKNANPIDNLGKELAADHTLAKARGEVVTGAEETAADAPEPDFVGEFENIKSIKAADCVAGDIAIVGRSIARFDGKKFSVVIRDIVDEYSLPADHTEAFGQSLAKLEEVVLRAEFTSGSLVDNFRDVIILAFKERPKQWSQMSQQEQRDYARQLEAFGKELIRKLVRVVVEGEEISLIGKLESYSHKGSFDLKISAASDEDAALQLFRMQGHEVIIRSADAERFVESKVEAKTDPDQPALFADGNDEHLDDKPEPAAPPADDSDLAGDDADPDDKPADVKATEQAEAAKPKKAPRKKAKADEEPVKVSGTGADAIAAMNTAAAEEKAAAETGDGQDPGEYESRSNPDDGAQTDENTAGVACDYVGPAEPNGAAVGESWHNTEDGKIRYWHGSRWYLGKPETRTDTPASDDDGGFPDVDE